MRVKGSSRATGRGYFSGVAAILGNVHLPQALSPGRWGLTGRGVRLLLATGMAVVLAAGPAAAYASARGGAAAAQLPVRAAGAAASQGPKLSQDLSGTLPTVGLHEAVGDFLGLGHDQLAVTKDSGTKTVNGVPIYDLDIYNASKYGGKLLRSTPTDMLPWDALSQYGYHVWQSGCGFLGLGQCKYQERAGQYSLGSIQIAADSSNLYMAGWNLAAGGPYLLQLPHNGGCASASCAVRKVRLPDFFQGTFGGQPVYRSVIPTSLAVGVVGGHTYIAVGLSDYGVYIFNQNLDRVATIGDMNDADSNQTPVISLAFGPPTGPGQVGVLVGGIETPGRTAYTWHLNPDGTEKSVTRSDFTSGGDCLCQIILSTAAANINGRLMSVFGRSDGDVLVQDPDSGAVTMELPPSERFGAVTGLTPVTSWDNNPTNQDLVVGNQDNKDAEVLQDVDGALKALPIGTGGATRGTNDQVEDWFPGYEAGRLHVTNKSAGPVTIAMASRPDPGYGCWLNASVTQPPVPAFPLADTPLATGATSPDFFAGALTAGADGSCASAQPASAGERATYVIITPVGDAADEHIVKLTAAADGTLSVAAQVGGGLTAALSQAGTTPGSWGTWQLTVTGGSTPTSAAAPTVTGYRLTAAPDPATYQPPTSPAANDPCRPVYRFDVTGAQWTHVASAGQVTAQIPAMTAQGSSDRGKTWTDLGQLMPSAAPAYAADPAHPDNPQDGTVTLGPASFFFQNAPGTATAPGVWTAAQPSQCPATGDQPVTEVRVVSGGLASAPVMLADPKAPPLDSTLATKVDGITATPDAPDGSANPRADGVDQAGLTLQLTPSDGGSVDPSDPRYSLVYYRDDATKALVTGLYQPGGYADYTAVGRYAADGTAGQPNRNWLVTTSTAMQHLDPVMNDSGTVNPTTGNSGSPFQVRADNPPLTPGGTATGGIRITGPTGTCTLAVPAGTAPALYQAGSPADGPVTGLQLSATAITGRASLPLYTGKGVHNLGSAPLVVTASQAQLTDTTQFFPTDTVDTALVTAGQLVPVLSVPVAG